MSLYEWTIFIWEFFHDVNEEKQLLFTGGPDCLVRIWNPFDPKKPNAILRGHQTTVCTILSLKNNNQLFTLSKDRCIKLWDCESHLCIQVKSIIYIFIY